MNYPKKNVNILAIDTSCDDTSVSILHDDKILSNIISSQVSAHEKWGGVVPSLAKRMHAEIIDEVINLALKRARLTLADIDYFAVTKGPGLAIALEVGIAKAKELSLKFKKPLIPVNHMEGHIYSCLAKNSKGNPKIKLKFPCVAVLISGGHTEFVLMKNHGDYQVIGKTLDDAIGESFDKVGRLVGLGYPAGPALEKIAENGNANHYKLPIAMKEIKSADMSYSGLKTATMKLVSELGYENLNKKTISNICASFQKVAFDQLVMKLSFALEKLRSKNINVKKILVGGGVSQNKYIRKLLRKSFGKTYEIYFPSNKKLYTDNAAMIGVAGFYNILRNNFLSKEEEIKDLDREPSYLLH